MKFIIGRDEALAAMSHIQRVVERKTTIPIINNVLLTVSESSLSLKATDLDMEVTETLPAQVTSKGTTSVLALMLYEILRKLQAGSEISIEQTDKHGVVVKSGRSRFTLRTLPEEDFPNLSAGDLPTSFEIPAADLKRLIDKTRFAISTEETRYYLNGIYLHIVQDGKVARLRSVATDGHRLAQAEMTAPSGSEKMPGVIIPRKVVSEVQKMVEEGEEPVTIEMSPNKIRFTRGKLILTSKLIDGTFPDYHRVIPDKNDKTLKVDKNEFVQAVDRVSTVSSERGRAVKLTLDTGKLTLSVSNPESGTAVEEMEVDYSAAKLEIGFNARYLLDISQQLEGETAVLEMSDPGAPALIHEGHRENALFVLMPMWT